VLELSPLPITAALTGAMVLLLVTLSLLVTARRAVLGGIQFGDADDVELRHRIRAHGNFVEIAPVVIIAIALMELAGASSTFLWWLAGVFFIGRVLHAARMYLRTLWPGLIAMITQHVICLIAGVWLLDRFVF
jgi:uncharacterized protein